MTGGHHHHHHSDRRRSIRPRPINQDERLQVVFLSKKKDAAGDPLDVGLIEFLKGQEAEREKEHKHHLAQQQAAAAAAGTQLIPLPQVRPVEDYEATNLPALREEPRYSALDPATAPYFRYQDMWVRQTVEQVVTAYDMDDEDRDWLDHVFPTKAAKNAGEGGKELYSLTPEAFEGLIQRLELLHFELLKQRSATFDKDLKVGKVPRIPSTEAVLSRSNAVRSLVSAEEPQLQAWVVEAVYDHWKARRKQLGGPLLQHLWFEHPWKAKCFADPDDPQELGDMPFVLLETRNSVANARLRMSDKEAWELLAGVREELEGLRTLADQVRRREKQKKQLLKHWRDKLRLGGSIKKHTGRSKKQHAAPAGHKAAPKAKAAAAKKHSQLAEADQEGEGVRQPSKAAQRGRKTVEAKAGSSKEPAAAPSSLAADRGPMGGSRIVEGILPRRSRLGAGALGQQAANGPQPSRLRRTSKPDSQAPEQATGAAGQKAQRGASKQQQPAQPQEAAVKSAKKESGPGGPSKQAATHDGKGQGTAAKPTRAQLAADKAKQAANGPAAGNPTASARSNGSGLAAPHLVVAHGRSPTSPAAAALLVEQGLKLLQGGTNKRGLRELAGLRSQPPAPADKGSESAHDDSDTPEELERYIALVSPPHSDEASGRSQQSASEQGEGSEGSSSSEEEEDSQLRGSMSSSESGESDSGMSDGQGHDSSEDGNGSEGAEVSSSSSEEAASEEEQEKEDEAVGRQQLAARSRQRGQQQSAMAPRWPDPPDTRRATRRAAQIEQQKEHQAAAGSHRQRPGRGRQQQTTRPAQAGKGTTDRGPTRPGQSGAAAAGRRQGAGRSSEEDGSGSDEAGDEESGSESPSSGNSQLSDPTYSGGGPMSEDGEEEEYVSLSNGQGDEDSEEEDTDGSNFQSSDEGMGAQQPALQPRPSTRAHPHAQQRQGDAPQPHMPAATRAMHVSRVPLKPLNGEVVPPLNGKGQPSKGIWQRLVHNLGWGSTAEGAAAGEPSGLVDAPVASPLLAGGRSLKQAAAGGQQGRRERGISAKELRALGLPPAQHPAAAAQANGGAHAAKKSSGSNKHATARQEGGSLKGAAAAGTKGPRGTPGKELRALGVQPLANGVVQHVAVEEIEAEAAASNGHAARGAPSSKQRQGSQGSRKRGVAEAGLLLPGRAAKASRLSTEQGSRHGRGKVAQQGPRPHAPRVPVSAAELRGLGILPPAAGAQGTTNRAAARSMAQRAVQRALHSTRKGGVHKR